MALRAPSSRDHIDFSDAIRSETDSHDVMGEGGQVCQK